MEQDQDLMKILVATDNHLGFEERNPIRGGDSLETFKEILTIAKEKQVDFILLGGDLFHENKPSRHVLHRTMELLRQFCMGSRPCPIEFRSDPSVNFVSSFPLVNYEDPNYNIDIPVFSIHGNHDDPTGERSLSAMDLLSVCNLVNYFGKSQNVEDIEISPILIQKGSTKLALYGLGSIRDERLARMFKYNKVKFLRPKEDQGNWFNILVLHQNRAQHSENNHIPPSVLPSFMDLVVWGHEHECHTEVEYEGDTHSSQDPAEQDTEDQWFYIYQPGSSVATSLSEGEVAKKHVGVLSIKETDFKLDPIPLKTVRPFMMDTVCLSKTGIDPLDLSRLQSYLQHKVEGLIDAADVESPDSEKLPLIRLRVDYTGDYPVIPQNRFGQQFVGKVANPHSILNWFKKKRQATIANKGHQGGVSNTEDTEDQVDDGDEQDRTSTIATLLEEQLKKEKLSILSEKSLVEAVNEFVDKNEKDAITDFVNYSLQQTQDFLKSEDIAEIELTEKIDQERETIMERQEQATEEARRHLETTRASRLGSSHRFSGESDGDSDSSFTHDQRDHSLHEPATQSSGRGRGRARGRARGTRGTAKVSRGGGTKKSRQSQLNTTGATATSQKRPASATRKKSTPKIVYQDTNNEEVCVIHSSDSSSDDPFAIPPTSKKRKS